MRSDQAPLWSNNLPNELSVRIEGSTHAVSENRMIDLFTNTCLCAKDITRHATLRYNEASWEKHEAVRVTSVSKRGVAWYSSHDRESVVVVMIERESGNSHDEREW